MKRVSRRLLSVTMALALVFSAVIPAMATEFIVPTAPMDTQDNVIKTTATRAGQVAPLILGCNLVAGSNLGASQDDYNKVATILGVFGSAANDKPDPYLYNYNYNTYAARENLPLVEQATIATEQAEGGGSSDPNALMNATLTHKPDLCLTQAAGTGNSAEWEDYNAVIATYPENMDEDTTNDYKPSYYTCSISTLVYQCENLINLAKVVNSVCEAKSLTTRYDKDPYEIATDYDKYVWGHYFYVQKMLEEKKITKKKVAVVSSSPDSGATWQLPAVGTAVSQAKPNRLVEYVRDNTDLLNTTTAGTATLTEIMDCDVLIANGLGSAIRSAAAAAGIDEDDLPMIVETLPSCLYGMVMQTHENALGIPYIQSIIYGTDLELNPVYAAAYFYQNFFHITDENALKETVNTLLGEATLPEGTTTSIEDYDPQNVEDIIVQGMDYAAEKGLKRHDDTEAWNPDRTLGIGKIVPEEVKAVEAAIAAIGEVTPEKAAAVKAARDAYDALTDEQKAMVSADALKTLEAAEAAIKAGETAITVATQDGKSGTPVVAKEYKNADLANLKESKEDGYGYVFYKNDAANATAVTEYVTLDNLLKDAGVTFEAGDTLAFTCSDGPYTKGNFSYENISARGVDADGNMVPTGFAIKWNNGSLADGTVADIAAKAKDTGSIRFVSGMTADEKEAKTAAGNRMPTGVVNVTVVKPKAINFSDVEAGKWYTEGVRWAVDNGVTNGTSDTTFSPDNTCNRGQMVTFLYRAAGSPAVTSTNNPFVDVKEGAFYYDAVLWAVEKGITKGMDDTHFGPNANVSRGQAVTFMNRIDNEKASSSDNPFEDVKEGTYFYDSVLWAVEKGITNGVDKTHFGPDTTCTRAHIVTFLERYMG